MTRLLIHIQGIVQGVGFRPFVYREATALSLSGFVQNGGDGVTIEAQGPEASLQQFVQNLQQRHPPQASLRSFSVSRIESQDESSFQIIESAQTEITPTLPADMALCEDCRREVSTPGERRYQYPFTNCTNCGPRYTIVTALPYDRPFTSMRMFPLCGACNAEYHDPLDRRFHAQPIACPTCGPALSVNPSKGDLQGNPIAMACASLRDGCIIAMQGLGGFQLLVDAQNADAVRRLRERKSREEKPFALLFHSLAQVRQHCMITAQEGIQLLLSEAPIVLLQRLSRDSFPGVAPDSPYLGVMLAYTPLHLLLSDAFGGPLVCTSGNLSDEPMCITTEDALLRLKNIADVFLFHNRPIVRPVDDSVGIQTLGGFSLLRRARGYAPRPASLPVSSHAPSVLSVGGHLKNTITLTIGAQAITSQHIGDLHSVESTSLLRRTIQDLTSFFRVSPTRIVCDLHPDYASTQIAEELSLRWKIPLLRVQHHHAHLAACAAEHQLIGEAVGFAWDGTGFGSDDTIWGGEMLRIRGSSFERVASLYPFRLAGGDRAAKDPRRCALGLLHEISTQEASSFAHKMFSLGDASILLKMLQKETHSPLTSSIGRLFDGISALLLSSQRQSFEGQAAMALEFAIEPETSAYSMPIMEGETLLIDWRPMLRELLLDIARGVPVGVCSAKFHNALVCVVLHLVDRLSLQKVLFGGGCFQNLYLRDNIHRQLSSRGVTPLFPQKFPANDGGLSLGQAYVALGDFLCA
jgi:hydrogenase maturation protein HypF